MPYPLPLTRTEAYLAYKAGVIQQSDLKPSLAVPRNGIDAWLAYWTGLAADYPKREDGTPHILQEEEAYIAYLCGVVNEYPEKCLRRVGAYLRYLISARWGRPDHPLNREELYLSLIKTQFVPSGDPSSDIEIDGTAKAAFVDIKMYGDTFQQSYTGKNLLKFVASTAGLNGLTVSYNEASGIVRVSGTPTQNWANIDSTTKTMSLKAGSYILSVDNPSPLYRLNFRIYDPTASGGYLDIHGVEGGNYVKFTLDHDINDVAMRAYIDHNYDMTAVDWSFKIMLESGSDITLPYEPYVGGIPSPNPEYPQPIQTVTGLQTVEIQGKNLFNKDKALDNYFYTTTGSASTYPKAQFYNNKFFTKSNKITMSFSAAHDKQNGSNIDANVRIVQYDASGNFISKLMSRTNGYTFMLDTNTKSFILSIDNGPDAWFDDLQIEYGSSATAYEPYISNDYEINLGKNLFNKNDVVNGIPSASDGSIISTSGAGRTSDYIPVMSNTAYSHTGHPAGWATIAWYKADKSFIQRVDNITTTTSPNEAAYARVSCAQSNLDTCQFEAGEPTEYAPYFTPIELCKLGNYQDYIWKDGEDWKVHKATANITLNNTADTSNWSKSNSTANNVYINQNIPNLVKDSPLVATNLTAYDTSDIYNSDIVGICYNTTGAGLASIRIGVGLSGASTVSLFKSWLEENPVTTYYALAAATDTVIADQSLIAQLEALVKGGSEDGTTYIKLSTPEPNLPGLLYVEAAKYI